MEEESFMRKLSNYPELQSRFEEILGIVENVEGAILTADEAEERAIVEVRKLGQEVLRGWSKRRAEEVNRRYEKRRDLHRDGKKTAMGIAASAGLK